MLNPFRVLVALSAVLAIALAAWFVYVVFVDPGNNGSLNRADSAAHSLRVEVS